MKISNNFKSTLIFYKDVSATLRIFNPKFLCLLFLYQKVCATNQKQAWKKNKKEKRHSFMFFWSSLLIGYRNKFFRESCRSTSSQLYK
jgi:hypothetical protein